MKQRCSRRDSLIKPGSNKPSYDAKWGRFLPKNWVNVIRLFAVNRKTTCKETPAKELRKYHKLWLAIQLLIWIMFNGSCVYPKWWWFEDFCGTGKRISEDEKNHIISQLMSTGRQMHGHKCMCWLGKKYTCPNYETPWWIRIILWHFGGTMYNFFPTRSPKMRGIVWCNLKKWYKPLATCGCRFWKNFKITGLSRTIVDG